MKCPICGKKLITREGRNGTFLGCSGYPSCEFTTSNSNVKKEELEDRLQTWRNIKKFLKTKHDKRNCNICHGGSDGEFFNSLYHDLMNKGSLSKRQKESIEKRANVHARRERRTEFKYPLKQQLNRRDLEELDKHGL